MDTSNVLSLLEDLDEEIDDLEDALKPFLDATLSEAASKTPLLDKAKLYVLVTYAIESMLFSYLRLNGVNARQHPVFTELTRVKQYFEKLKLAENPIGKRENLSVDKKAAARIIKAGTTGFNNTTWQEEAEKERVRAHIKFDELTEKMKQDEISKKRKAEESSGESSDSESESDSESDSNSSAKPLAAIEAPKKEQRTKDSTDSLPTSAVSSDSKTDASKQAKPKGKTPKQKVKKNIKKISSRKEKKQKKIESSTRPLFQK